MKENETLTLLKRGGDAMVPKVNRENPLSRVSQRQWNNFKACSGYGLDFQTILEDKTKDTQEIHFSKHATERIQQRGMKVTQELLGQLNQAVAKARAKGAQEVVIIGEQGAFIVNIPNNVVVTTMTQREMKDNVFTNIDGAVIL